MYMSLLAQILGFIGIQLLKAILTAQAVKDATLFVLKKIAKSTKTKFDDHIYSRVRYYMNKDQSERFDEKK